MKRRFVAAGLALVSTAALAFAVLNLRSIEPPAARMSNISYDAGGAAPQTKFGIREALLPGPSALRAPSVVEKMNRIDVKEEPPRADPAIAVGDLSPGLPKIAYRYEYGFRLDPDALAGVQRAHADYCERQGPMVCRIVAMEQSGEDGERTSGTLELAVASTRARGFGAELSKQVSSAGGKEVASSISGEDLSKAIVDTEARLRARTLLRDRLMEVLATRKGTVAELVEAERGVAQVNEEIDEARSWLTEMKGRVMFSSIHIGYANLGAPLRAESQSGFWAPIRSVFGALGGILGTTIAVIIALAAILVPVGALGWAGRKAWLRVRPRWIAAVEA